ncbi:MAG: UvrD-helicase domain-containing protein, partial [Candidatus Marinimicrobia bacterium]|nr:UvrD-helicase domain-containing protein [Candidatus Neomarinimicrobiota bacterium]
MNYRKLFTPGPNKIIQASAGTGKTFILSKYYCSILDDWLNTGKSSGVDNILVLTFTNKAAAEMKAKIFQDLKSLSAGKNIEEFTNEGFTDFAPALRSDDPRFKGEKEKYLRLFGNNKITTIDAFCGQILRRYCDRMNLDPLFSTEDEAIDKKLREESWKEFLTRKNRKQSTDLYYLLDYLSENQLKTACFEIHDKKQELDSWRKNSADSESLELRKTVIEHYAKTTNLNQFLIELNTLLSSIREFPDDKWCRIHIPTLEKVLNSCQNSSNNETCISDCLNNIQGLFLKANGLEYYKVANSFTKDKKLKSILKDFLKILPELLPTTLNNSDLQLFDFYPQLHNFSESFSQFLSNKRRNLNLLSFDDVIRLTGDLLRRDLEIRKQLHEQYKYILVDEFQDTNDKRWEIIRMILDPENTNDIQRLFIVGDTKQSIYAFQNADVKVMNRASAFLKKQSATELYTLETNFRSSANYINKLINPLFSSLMPSEISEVKAFDSIYENCQVLGKFKEADSPLILNLSEKDDITDPKGASQCANAAAEAVHWCEKNLDNWKEKNEPVAVLLRKFTNIQFYQEAFRKKDLNFKIISGKSFWQQQEIRDIEQLLRFLNNPHDDPALLALLRSPLLNCRDKDIYEAASQSKKS